MLDLLLFVIWPGSAIVYAAYVIGETRGQRKVLREWNVWLDELKKKMDGGKSNEGR